MKNLLLNKERIKASGKLNRPRLVLILNPKPSLNSIHRFTFGQKILLFILFTLGMLFCSILYSSGPDILTATPRHHSFGKTWEQSKYAQLKTLAMLIEMYPDHEIYFLDRDARFLGQTGLLIGEIENDPTLKNRIHFLNVSRENVKDPLLKEYLKQEGISEKSLEQGKKILFIDTGFIGSLPRHIMSLFPNHKEQFRVQMVEAAPAAREYRSPFPSMRVFGTEFSKYYPQQDILLSNLNIVYRYALLPKSELRSDSYVIDPQGKIIPKSSLGSRDANDGEINPIKTRQYEEDLQDFMRNPANRFLLDKLRREWKTAYSLWKEGDKPKLVNELKRWIETKGPQGLAMAMDFIEMNHTNLVGNFLITPEDLGIKRQEFNINPKRLTKHNLPVSFFRSCLKTLQGLNK